MEAIESQREIYEADRKADSVNLKRLLRDCLRQEDIHNEVLDLAEHEFFSFKNALQLVRNERIHMVHTHQTHLYMPRKSLLEKGDLMRQDCIRSFFHILNHFGQESHKCCKTLRTK